LIFSTMTTHNCSCELGHSSHVWSDRCCFFFFQTVVAILDWSPPSTLSKFERCYLSWFWQELGFFMIHVSSELNPPILLSLLGYSSHKLSMCTSVDQFWVRTNWVQFALCTSYISIIIQNAAAITIISVACWLGNNSTQARTLVS
jgi:hypothetical protein